jgi:methylmalonyl-CoA/ethylmalonyl-CoA epimerase
MRVALTTKEYERIVELYTTGLGIEPAALWTTDTTRAVLLEMGRATLEIFDEGHAAEVDRIEVGERVSGQIRFALLVPDVEAAAQRLIA